MSCHDQENPASALKRSAADATLYENFPLVLGAVILPEVLLMTLPIGEAPAAEALVIRNGRWMVDPALMQAPIRASKFEAAIVAQNGKLVVDSSLMGRRVFQPGLMNGTAQAMIENTQGALLQDGRWIGSKVSLAETEAALGRMTARLKGLKAGGDDAIEGVEAFGSRAGSTFRGRGPIEASDLDLYIKDRPGSFEGSRFDSGLRQKIKQITGDFTSETGIKIDLKIHSDDPFMRIRMNPPFEKLK
jgi:hypothetical protein